MARLTHIIVAAGSGSRFGADLPKQFVDLDGRPVLMTTITRLASTMRPGDDMIVVLSASFVNFWHELCRRHGFESPRVVVGGASRWQSVRNALLAVDPDCEIVTVHDGARPLVTARVVTDAVKAVEEGADGAIPVVPLTDSLRCVGPDGTSHAEDRSRFRAVQTPQAFPAAKFKQAYAAPESPLFTDDASVMEAAGFTDLRLTPGDPDNIKITHPRDIAIAQAIIDYN